MIRKITLVLLPGMDGTGKLFQPFVAALPDSIHVQVIAYPTNTMLSVDEYSEFVKNRLPSGRIVLLAESFSGLVALTLMASGDRKIEAVVFCASFAEPPRPWLLLLARLVPYMGFFIRMVPAVFLRRFCIGTRANEQQLSLLREAILEVSAEVLTDRLRIIATERFVVRGRYGVPCYYLQATNDHLVPSHMIEWFGQNFEFFRCEKVEGPHFLLQAYPQECAQRIMSILNEIEGGVSVGQE